MEDLQLNLQGRALSGGVTFRSFCLHLKVWPWQQLEMAPHVFSVLIHGMVSLSALVWQNSFLLSRIKPSLSPSSFLTGHSQISFCYLCLLKLFNNFKYCSLSVNIILSRKISGLLSGAACCTALEVARKDLLQVRPTVDAIGRKTL